MVKFNKDKGVFLVCWFEVSFEWEGDYLVSVLLFEIGW